jgi:flagellar hook-associated protein 2
MQLQLDEEQFLEALNDNRSSVEQLFSNSAGTGIADKMFDYLDDMTRTAGFLNARIRTNGTIDRQIRLVDDRIDNMEQRLTVREDRLRRSFTRLEQLSAGFQQQNTAISGLASQMRFF